MSEDYSRRKASEFRHMLSVMEERSHLGLDDEVASNLRRILARRIANAESGACRESFVMVTPEEETELSLKA